MPPPSSAAFVCTAAQRHEQTVLVLQGGGALGAYQAGAFEGFAAAGVAPDWVAGVSIGAINAALIAGNPAVVVGDSREGDGRWLETHPELRRHYDAWAAGRDAR
mgnify:CR=1 FL=1